MNTINPYGSLILNGLFGQNTNAQSVQSAQILDAPTALKNLATNLILKGEITAQNARNEATITTPRGELTVRLKNDLPVGSKVDIQIPSGQQAKEVIIQPTLARAIQQNQQAQSQQQPTAQSQTQIQNPQTASTATIADVKNLQATATQATQNIANTLSNLNIGQAVRITPLPPSQQLQNYTLSTPLPVTMRSTLNTTKGASLFINQVASTPTPLTVNVLNTSSTPQTPIILIKGFSQNNQQTPIVEISPVRVRLGFPLTANINSTVPQTAMLSTGQPVPKMIVSSAQQSPPLQLDARLTTLSQPTVQMNSAKLTAQTTPQPPFSLIGGQASAGQIIATATGFVNVDGNPIVQTLGANNQIQLSTLHYPAKNLPAGTQMTLTPTGGMNVPSMVNQPSWKNMIQFVDEIASVFPMLTSQSLMSLIPNTAQPKSFPAAALLFLAAAKGGDLSGWLGTKIMRPNDNGQTISKKTIDLLMRDVATQTGCTATPSDPPMVQSNADWRGHILPLILGADIHQATFWAKGDEGNQTGGDDQKIGGTRFVVDLSLSRMGDVYFDGLIHPEKQTFDLALITEREISTPMQNSIKSIWHTTLGGLGLDGVITFKDTA